MISAAVKSRRPLPMWANLLIAFVVIVITAAVSGTLATMLYVQNLVSLFTDPTAIIADAKAVGQLPEPLPEGYHYLGGVNLLKLLYLLVIEHTPDHQQMMIYCLQSSPSDDKEPKNLLDRAYDIGINTSQFTVKFQELKSTGTATVAGLSMPYRIGQYTDPNGKSAMGMVGCICVNKPAKNILIYSYPMPGNAYNHEVTMTLLNAIKGF